MPWADVRPLPKVCQGKPANTWHWVAVPQALGHFLRLPTAFQDEDINDDDDDKEPLSRTAALRRRLTRRWLVTVPALVSALLIIAGLALVTVRPSKQVRRRAGLRAAS